MSSVRLALRVLRVDRRSRTSAILTVLGTAVATTLILLLLGVPYATQDRATRVAWQQPTAPALEGQTTMSRAVSTDYTDGAEITRVDVAALADESAIELPPGMPTLPGPGEVVVSPALAQRIAALPPERLAERFPGEVVAKLGKPALAHPDQLVAVVGHTPGAMPPTAHPMQGFPTDQVWVDYTLRVLAGVGVVVLIMPSLVLVGSASRLTAASRERRLAALRLAGATPGQVSAQVATETTIAAASGALLGLASMPFSRELAALVPWEGGTWQAADFATPAWLTALVVVAIPVFVLLAALLALRRVFTSPLGAGSGHTPKPLHWWRLLTVPAAGLLLFVALSTRGSTLLIFGSLAALVAAAGLVGPWLTAAVGRIFVRSWRGPAALLAGRRLTDDPRGAYRASAGVVIAVFTGSMALTVLSSVAALVGGGRPLPQDTLYVDVPVERANAVAHEAQRLLDDYGVQTDVTVRSRAVPQDERTVTVAAGPEIGDVARTALVRAGNGRTVSSPRLDLAGQRAQLRDLRRVTVLGLGAAALLAGCSVAIATAGSILDRRRTFGALIAAGTPVRVLTRALRVESAIPTLVATVGAGVIGTLVGAGFFRLVDDADVTFTPWVAAPVALGAVAALLAGSVCRPSLARVRAEPLAQE